MREFIGKQVTIYTKTQRRFSGEMLEIKDGFIKLNDRYVGMKFISVGAVDNVELWKGGQ